MLNQVPLFARLPADALQQLATRLRRKRYGRGQAVFHEGDPGGSLCIVAEGHIKLVETMAERIAERCLSDKRIASVLVRVEKLERGPASVGVEIVRPRTAVPAGDLTHLKR